MHRVDLQLMVSCHLCFGVCSKLIHSSLWEDVTEEKSVTHDQDLKEKRKRPGSVVLYFTFQKIKKCFQEPEDLPLRFCHLHLAPPGAVLVCFPSLINCKQKLTGKERVHLAYFSSFTPSLREVREGD